MSLLVRAVVVMLVATLTALIPGAAQAAPTKTTCQKFDSGNIEMCVSVRKVRGKVVASGFVRKLDGRSNRRDAIVFLKRERCPGGQEQTVRKREDIARGDATARARTGKADYSRHFFYRGVLVGYYAREIDRGDHTSIHNSGQEAIRTSSLGGTACQ